jgi:hypothetical protein
MATAMVLFCSITLQGLGLSLSAFSRQQSARKNICAKHVS